MVTARSRTAHVLIAALAVGASAIALVSMRTWGIGLSPDSASYIAAARSLAHGAAAADYPGNGLLFWPPLYSAMLGLTARSMRADPLMVAPWLHAGLMCATIIVGAVMAMRFADQPTVSGTMVASVLAVSPVLYGITCMALSESLFVFLVTADILLMELYSKRASLVLLIAVSAVCSLALLTRYIGVFLVLWGVICTLITDIPLRKRLWHCAAFVAIAVTPTAMWVCRNWLLTGMLMGPRASSAYHLAESVKLLYESLCIWLVPQPFVWYESVRVMVALGGGILLVYSFARNKSRLWSKFLDLLRPSLVAVIYVIALLLSSITTNLDPIGDRLLSPIFVPLVVVAVVLCGRVAKAVSGRYGPQRSTAVLLVLAAVWMAFVASTTFSGVAQSAQNGRGYGSRQWQESDMLVRVSGDQRVVGQALYSNCAPPVVLLADLPARWIPARSAYNSADAPDDVSELFGEWPPEGSAYLVWFDANTFEHLYTLDELGSICDLRRLESTSDGALYLATKAQPATMITSGD